MNKEQAHKLREAFPPSAIGQLPKAGLMLDYVGHAATTDRLLAVDPDWSWEPFALDENGLPALDAEGNLWIRLTVCGVTRPGVGDGKTAKERIGDAIRNAAMRFGVALDLWAKEDLQSNGHGSEDATQSLVERQKARIRARQQSGQVVAGGPEPAPHASEEGTYPLGSTPPPTESGAPSTSTADADSTEEPQKTGNTIAASTRDKPATKAQKDKMNVLVGTLRDREGKITTRQLWVKLAKHRNVLADGMIELLDGRDEFGELHWAPLRESMTRAEAHMLIDALEGMESAVG